MSRRRSKNATVHRPFANLKVLLEKADFSLPQGPEPFSAYLAAEAKTAQREDDESLFRAAMAGVEPISRGPYLAGPCPPEGVRNGQKDPEREALSRLEGLLAGGHGFVVAQTSEYMEGTGYGVEPDVARRLHEGEFALQGHIDLHGLTVGEAQEAFDGFLREARYLRKRAVLIVHGRGRSSQDQPVLKTKVKEWLTTGPWRKWVIAFCSARSCDGGAGATYVLLRERPATRRHRKGKGP